MPSAAAVPAWRRLGLKLKSDRDVKDAGAGDAVKRRKLDDGRLAANVRANGHGRENGHRGSQTSKGTDHEFGRKRKFNEKDAAGPGEDEESSALKNKSKDYFNSFLVAHSSRRDLDFSTFLLPVHSGFQVRGHVQSRLYQLPSPFHISFVVSSAISHIT
ncbi:hypothetical protein BDY21DRAFT_211813 [Lineolata rhizophorae]|uniref:Uncharacterized protein n=1 Tax=Lineolata rhizophorae TaxID=578093 RepID=A0A6A6P4S9_9PEZI|nr:hypothetical protein BDY21DRAFT_211813 [Lineolata rhizophorae]